MADITDIMMGDIMEIAILVEAWTFQHHTFRPIQCQP